MASPKTGFVRRLPNERFVMVRNGCAHDPKLSLKAKGLLLTMLAFPEDWVYHISHIETLSKDGRDSTRSAINELISEGYISRERVRGEDGKYLGYNYTIADYPHHDGKTGNGFPVAGANGAGANGAGDPEATNTYRTKTYDTKTYSLSVSLSDDPMESAENEKAERDSTPKTEKAKDQTINPFSEKVVESESNQSQTDSGQGNKGVTPPPVTSNESGTRRKPTNAEMLNGLIGKQCRDPVIYMQTVKQDYPRTYEALLKLKKHTDSKPGKRFTAETFQIWIDMLYFDGLKYGDELMEDWIVMCIGNDVGSALSYYRKIRDTHATEARTVTKPSYQTANRPAHDFNAGEEVVCVTDGQTYIFDTYIPSSGKAVLETLSGGKFIEVPLGTVERQS